MEEKITAAAEEYAPAETKSGGQNRRRTRREKFWAYFRRNYMLYLMTIPAVVLLLIFNYYPMAGLQLAFKDWNP